MCVTTYLKAMLTDGFFCFPFLLVPQTTLYIRPLCFMADCLLPHLLITGWLLTIYSIAWFIMPFLGLDATQRGKYDYYSKSCGRSYLPYSFIIRVSRVLDFSKCEQVGHEPTRNLYSLPALCIVMELKNLLHCQYADDIQSDDKCGKHRNREYGAKEIFFYCFLVGSTENL